MRQLIDFGMTGHMFRPMPDDVSPVERRVKLFRNGRNQAVRIPRGFELPGDEAVMRKEGARLVIEPMPRKSLAEVLASLSPIDEEFPLIDDPPPEPFDLCSLDIFSIPTRCRS